MSAPAKTNEIDPLLHPAHVAKLLAVSPSWLAKSRLNGTGPRFTKIGRRQRFGRVVQILILESPLAFRMSLSQKGAPGLSLFAAISCKR
jgi:hypothetical protein